MSNYLIHSAKGTSWKNHKYVKIVNGKYYYSDDLKGEKSSGDIATSQSSAQSYLDSLKVKKLGIKAKSSGKSKASSKGSKEKSESSKASKTPAEKTSKSKSTSEKTTKTVDSRPNSYYGVKGAISKKVSIGEKDSIYSSANEDGTWRAEVVFEDGSTQSFTLDKDYNIIDYTEKQIKHSFYSVNSLTHNIRVIGK